MKRVPAILIFMLFLPVVARAIDASVWEDYVTIFGTMNDIKMDACRPFNGIDNGEKFGIWRYVTVEISKNGFMHCKKSDDKFSNINDKNDLKLLNKDDEDKLFRCMKEYAAIELNCDGENCIRLKVNRPDVGVSEIIVGEDNGNNYAIIVLESNGVTAYDLFKRYGIENLKWKTTSKFEKYLVLNSKNATDYAVFGHSKHQRGSICFDFHRNGTLSNVTILWRNTINNNKKR